MLLYGGINGGLTREGPATVAIVAESVRGTRYLIQNGRKALGDESPYTPTYIDTGRATEERSSAVTL